mgnify:CR=1 FL=1
MLQVRNIEKYYGSKNNVTKALDRVSFEVDDGEFIAIMGASGSGKTTLLNCISTIDTVSAGDILLDGESIAALPPRELARFRRERLGFVFQDFNLLDTLTLEENIGLALSLNHTDPETVQRRVREMAARLEIMDVLEKFPYQVSGGQKQRAACARAMVAGQSLLLADEPTGALDSKASKNLLEIMTRMNRDMGATILMVTHDMGSIIKYCDRVVLLNKGEFIAEGPAGRVVDMYKKILAGQLDSLKAELERERQQKESLTGEIGQEDAGSGVLTGAGTEETETAGSRAGAGTKSGGVEMSDFSGGMGLEGSRLMKDQLTINYDRTEYGDGRAEIVDLGLFDERGNITNLLLKGEMFTIKERIHFNTEIQSPIFTYTIKDKKGTELTGTNTMFEGAEIQPVKRGDEYVVEFTQKMTLQGGEYLLSMSCTGFEMGQHVVYHRLYDVTNITVISNKNTVGVYDMESQVKAEKRKGNG